MSAPDLGPAGPDPVPRYLGLVLPRLGDAVPDALALAATDLATATGEVAAAHRGAGPRASAVLAHRATTLDVVAAELACVQDVLADLRTLQRRTAARADAAMELWWSATAALPPWSPVLGALAHLVCRCLDGVRADHAADLRVLTAFLEALAGGSTVAAGRAAAG